MINNLQTIQYDTAKLKQQWGPIASSRFFALRKLSQDPYCQALGLDKNDPLELWRFVIGRSPIRKLPDLADPQEKALAERFREFDPEIVTDPVTYLKFREWLGAPTLAETVLALDQRFEKSPSELRWHLTKLLTLYKKCVLVKRGHPTRLHRAEIVALARELPKQEAELATRLLKLLGLRNKGRLSREKTMEAKSKRLLCMDWLDDPALHGFDPMRSLCFYSDRAIAAVVHYRLFKQWLIPEANDSLQRRAKKLRKLDTEIRRIKQIYRRLRLRPANPRIIKDLELRFGELRFILFVARCEKRPKDLTP